jgi:superfamily I DNA/RNA helicase
VDPDEPAPSDLATALLGWAAAHPSLQALADAVGERRRLLAELRRDDAALTLATAHGTKGLEWDHVLVLADGFPGRRSVSDATEPERALEEERRLAYVAWTRARRSLTLQYDPEAASQFLREAFEPEELAPPRPGRAA